MLCVAYILICEMNTLVERAWMELFRITKTDQSIPYFSWNQFACAQLRHSLCSVVWIHLFICAAYFLSCLLCDVGCERILFLAADTSSLCSCAAPLNGHIRKPCVTSGLMRRPLGSVHQQRLPHYDRAVSGTRNWAQRRCSAEERRENCSRGHGVREEGVQPWTPTFPRPTCRGLSGQFGWVLRKRVWTVVAIFLSHARVRAHSLVHTNTHTHRPLISTVSSPSLSPRKNFVIWEFHFHVNILTLKWSKSDTLFFFIIGFFCTF